MSIAVKTVLTTALIAFAMPAAAITNMHYDAASATISGEVVDSNAGTILTLTMKFSEPLVQKVRLQGFNWTHSAYRYVSNSIVGNIQQLDVSLRRISDNANIYTIRDENVRYNRVIDIAYYLYFGDDRPTDTIESNFDFPHLIKVYDFDKIGLNVAYGGRYNTNPINVTSDVFDFSHHPDQPYYLVSSMSAPFDVDLATVRSSTTYNLGDYDGTFNLAFFAATPEPTTWAMMIVGFGLIGSQMRRNRAIAVSR